MRQVTVFFVLVLYGVMLAPSTSAQDVEEGGSFTTHAASSATVDRVMVEGSLASCTGPRRAGSS